MVNELRGTAIALGIMDLVIMVESFMASNYSAGGEMSPVIYSEYPSLIQQAGCHRN
jgi:hypothetical protein